MAPTVKLAEYLFQRLVQLGIGSVHGVPGDFNLTLLDYVEPAGLNWIGNSNELNAGYAADGYARIKGISALITTFGVGELSAINAIAGAYAERAAVVHIVGTPPRAAQDGRVLVHHTFADGNFIRFAQMSKHVTIAQASLRDPRTAPEQIDQVLVQCLLHSRPAYIEVPVDLVDVPILSERLENKLKLPEAVWGSAQDDALAAVLEKVHDSTQPIILADGEIRAMGIVETLQELTKKTNWPTWITGFAKGLLNETAPNFHGIYKGKWEEEATRAFFQKADVVLCFGPHFSTTNSWGGTSLPEEKNTIFFLDTEIRIGSKIFRDVPARQALSTLLQRLDTGKMQRYEKYPELRRDRIVSIQDTDQNGPITQDKAWKVLASFVREGDVVMGETGTPGYGAREMLLPPNTRLFTPVTWLSIGYMLPAAQGVALAQREGLNSNEGSSNSGPGKSGGRTILLIGDGSFQMTVQELGTIIKHNLNVVVFLINNDGYTIERCIHGVKQAYNDVARWRYLEALSFFGAEKDAYTASAKTWGELGQVLADEKLSDGKGVRMVEVFMGKEDTPEGPLKDLMEAQRAKGV
ncbi:thiamine pyrophosphate enzyme [Bimuria novae-zelandiae CBS 107.79]|uniref:Pyruvate decarboxylase n=1 Tax=Bimuria novae-zelandiae CBS 107.79 TaxID=1447943 RepID=A0A6A5VRN8_9PLEO|nr:thiamine pyrophosphate enzyme [Bimuria novae-zelandiae CBS 107.79]